MHLSVISTASGWRQAKSLIPPSVDDQSVLLHSLVCAAAMVSSRRQVGGVYVPNAVVALARGICGHSWQLGVLSMSAWCMPSSEGFVGTHDLCLGEARLLCWCASFFPVEPSILGSWLFGILMYTLIEFRLVAAVHKQMV